MDRPFGFWIGSAPRLWLDTWREATRWWTEPAAEHWSEAGWRLLDELIDGISTRFAGRHFDVVVGTRRVGGVLESLRLRRDDEDGAATAELSDVVWDGWTAQRLTVRAGGIRLARQAGIDISDVDVAGRAPLAATIARLNRELRWRLRLDDQGRVHVRRPRHALTVVVVATIHEHTVRVELRGVRWRALHYDLPLWLRVTGTRELPVLAHGLRIRHATPSTDSIDFRLWLPLVSGQLDFAALRDAISRGGPLVLPGWRDA